MRTAGIGSLTLVLVMTATAAGQPRVVNRYGDAATPAPDAAPARQRSAFDPPASDNTPGAFDPSMVRDNAFHNAPGGYTHSGFYGRAEYLLWWLKRDFGDVPPLVTQGDPADTPTGAVGQPGTSILFGGGAGSSPGSSLFSGGRGTLGFWFGELDLGLEVTCFAFVQRQHTLFHAENTGLPRSGSLNLAFFNNDGAFNDAFNIGLEGVQSGRIVIEQSQSFWGAELNVPWLAVIKESMQFTWLTGFRYLCLEENAEILSNSTALPANVGIRSSLLETFATSNNFYGAQIGTRTDFFCDSLRVTLHTKLAIGAMERNVNIAGITTNIDPVNGKELALGGLYTGPRNLGDHHHGSIAVAPEVGINFSYCVTENFSVSAGYSFLYLSGVVRPGDQIDTTVSFQTDEHPRLLLHANDFYAHGLNVGAVFRY